MLHIVIVYSNLFFDIDSFKADASDGKDNYTYVFHLCGDASGVPNAGLVQIDKKTSKKTVIGMYNSTQAIGGSKSLQSIEVS